MKILRKFYHEEYNQRDLNIMYLRNSSVKKAYKINDDMRINDHQVTNPIDIHKEL